MRTLHFLCDTAAIFCESIFAAIVVRTCKRITHLFSSNEGVPCVEILESFADCGMQSFYSECAQLKVLKY